MRQTTALTPVYTGDVSGVASALYELGGMVVIHDPSGCNSTYNTHDEIRWYEMESLIFISGLKERDAILGNDQKLIQDTVDAARQLHPRFIALCNSPVPYLCGTDFQGIARIIEKETNIPTFYIPTNGMHDYVSGAGAAFRCYAEKMLGNLSAEDDRKSCDVGNPANSVFVNILGFTPLDFAVRDSLDTLRDKCGCAGFSIQSIWAMESGADDLADSWKAAVNLVVSSTGYPVAKWMEKYYGIPYVCGIPTETFESVYFESVKRAVSTRKSQYPYIDTGLVKADCNALQVFCVGEPVTMGSLAASIRDSNPQEDIQVRVICPVEADKSLIGSQDIYSRGEEETAAALKDADLVIADPMYAPLCPEKAELLAIPQLAYSGRIYQKDIPNLFLVDAARRVQDMYMAHRQRKLSHN